MASTIDKIKNDFMEAVNASQRKTSAYDTEAEVVRIEGNTAWVHIGGGVTETPVQLTINAQKGDKVQVRVSNEGAWIMGNATAPPTDDKKANEADAKAAEAKYIAVDAAGAAIKADEAAQDAVASAEVARSAAQDAQTAASNAQTAAGNAVTAASNALTAAQNAQGSADAALVSLSTVEDVVGVLNWITAHGTMTLTSDVAINPAHVYFVVDPVGDYVVGGTHYSIVAEPKVEDISTYYELSVDESVQNYVATHVVVDTEGLWLIPDSGGNKVLIATGAGSSYTTAGTYIIGKVSGVDTVFAKFTTDGATMNATNSTQIAHLGYGSGNAESGTAIAPYYTLGVRSNNSAIGNYSTAEGYKTTASGYCSHAEGTPFGAPDDGPMATSQGSHAEGRGTQSTALGSHAEGGGSVASGNYSHAQNFKTIAQGDDQTALGRYNVADSTSAVIIGNGTISTRSNALTVDWNGNVNLKGQAKTSFKSSIAMGSYGSSQTTVPNLVEEVRFSSGCCGSVNIGTAYTANNVTIATGWYNFMYMPHRSGGVNGSASGDNCNYGNLFLFGMNNTNGRFIVRVSSGAIAEVAQIYTSIERYTRSNAGDLAWSSQADGDAKVIMKSALAFWNGAYNGTGSNLKYSNNGEILGKNIVKDWVTAQGTSGSWTYRKWNSGQIEAWYSGSLALTNDGQLSSASPTWYRSHYAVTVPSAVGMTTIKTANCSNTSPASFHMQANTAISGLTITQYCIRGGGTLTGNVTANIYVTGV